MSWPQLVAYCDGLLAAAFRDGTIEELGRVALSGRPPNRRREVGV